MNIDSKQGRTKMWTALVAAILVLAAAAGQGAASAQPSGGAVSAPEVIRIDTAAASRPFPHTWEKMFGSGRAILSLREGYRRDLREVKRITGFEYIRFHAILHDEAGFYSEDAKGQAVYNFSYIDQIYDGLLENGVRPFIEIGFMPRALSSSTTTHPFWYKPLPNPPKDYVKWDALVEAFTRHLVERYGLEEVSQWYFEVWNEPNIDFWSGTPKKDTYFELYDHTARAVKRVSARLRIGGPATAQAAWSGDFVRHCAAGKVPVDFVSTHVYANDTSEDVFATHEKIPRATFVARAAKKVFDEVKSSPLPDLPIIWSEYNASYMNEVAVTDSPFIGPWLANHIRQTDGLADIWSYWSFSDVFEEQGVVKTPFYGGYGLIAAGNIPKAAFNAFALLHRLGEQRIPNSSESVLVTRRTDGTLAIAVWNYFEPEQHGQPRQFEIELTGAAPAQAWVEIVDRDHGSALTAWEAMGKPATPSRAQQERLREISRMGAPRTLAIGQGKMILTLQPHALALIEVPPAK